MRHPFILSIPLLLPSAALPATGLGGTSFCFGDGSGATCPCANGNNGSNGPAGCANGTNPGGGRLSDSGCASLDEKSLVLLGTGLPTCGNAKSVLFLQGLQAPNAGQGQAFYAGLRCVTGGIVILEKTTYDAAGNAWSTGNVAELGGVSPGDLRRYQIGYADACGCMGSSYNLTNALEIVWAP